MMDANELAVIAYDAMPVEVLVPIDQGQVYGATLMALKVLEAQHTALLAEADEETAEAKKLWREALGELESAKAELAAMTVERDNALRSNSALVVELRNREAEVRNRDANLNASCKERDTAIADAVESHVRFEAVRKERDALQAENARLHRSLEERMTAHIPGAVQVAKTEELHGMADVYAQEQRMKAHLVPPGTDEL